MVDTEASGASQDGHDPLSAVPGSSLPRRQASITIHGRISEEVPASTAPHNRDSLEETKSFVRVYSALVSPSSEPPLTLSVRSSPCLPSQRVTHVHRSTRPRQINLKFCEPSLRLWLNNHGHRSAHFSRC